MREVATVVRHRGEVVRRLAERGLSRRTLELLFPGWADTIAEALPEEPGEDRRAPVRPG